jgi:Holliday junction resolvase RusA-like endonuclease
MPALLLEFTIPGNPGDGAVNAVWRSVVVPSRAGKPPTVRVLKSKRGKVFTDRATMAILASMGDAKPTAEVSVVIRAYWGRQRHLEGADQLPLGDVDAPIKATLDALQASKWLDDDSRVRSLRAEKYYDKADPRIEVEVWAVDA